MLAKDTKFAYKIFVSISVLPFRLFTTLTATAATATTTTTTARIKTENPSPNHQSTDTRPQQNTQNQHNKNRMIQRDSKSWNVRYIVRSKSGLQNNQLYFTLRTLPNSSLRYSIFEVHIVEMSQLNFRWQKVMHRNDIMLSINSWKHLQPCLLSAVLCALEKEKGLLSHPAMPMQQSNGAPCTAWWLERHQQMI